MMHRARGVGSRPRTCRRGVRMAQRPRKPDDATEGATMRLFPGGPSRNAPPTASAELTPPPGGEVCPTAESSQVAPPLQKEGEADEPGASTATPHPTPSGQTTAAPSAEDLQTPAPIPGLSTPPHRRLRRVARHLRPDPPRPDPLRPLPRRFAARRGGG